MSEHEQETNSFADWGDQGEDFVLPHERPAEPDQATPAPEAEPDPGELTADDAEKLAGLAYQGLQTREAAKEYVVAHAVQQWEDGEESPAVIADQLRDQYGHEIAAKFVQQWKAEDALWDADDEPEEPATADEWLMREEQQLQTIRAVQDAARQSQAAVEHAATQAEIQKTINETAKAMSQKHAAIYRRNNGSSVAPGADIIEIANRLGQNSPEPRTPAEAAAVTESLYRQAVALKRSWLLGEKAASFADPDSPDAVLAANYMTPTATQERHAGLPRGLDAVLGRFAQQLGPLENLVNPGTLAPRPSRREQLEAEVENEWNATQRVTDEGFANFDR